MNASASASGSQAPGARRRLARAVELWFGDSPVMIADEFPDLGIVSPRTLGGTYGALHITTSDVDALWQRAIDAGAEVFHPLGDMATHLHDVPTDEVARAAAEMFGG